MSIAERVNEDIKDSMRSKEAERLSVLRQLKAALMNAAIEKAGGPQGQLEEADEIAVVRKQVKQRQDSVENFEGGGRPELAAKEKAEIEYLQVYLPPPLSHADLADLIDQAIQETGATRKSQLSLVMKALQVKVAGRTDGKTLSQEVGKRLV